MFADAVIRWDLPRMRFTAGRALLQAGYTAILRVVGRALGNAVIRALITGVFADLHHYSDR